MTQKAIENYLDLSLREAYEVLTSNKDPWPHNFQPSKKIKFIDQLIEYFQNMEEYERCAELVKIKEKVTNVENNK